MLLRKASSGVSWAASRATARRDTRARRVMAPPLAAARDERLVDQRWKLAGNVAAVRQLVDHEDDDAVPDPIDVVRAAVSPTPAVRFNRCQAVGTVALGRLE